MTGKLTAAQAAQQTNRDSGGRYTEGHRADPGAAAVPAGPKVTVHTYGSVYRSITVEARCGAAFATDVGLIYPLTPCCHASAKGLEDYVGCRKCYAEVDPSYGDCAHLDNEEEALAMIDYLMGDHQGCEDAECRREVLDTLRAEHAKPTEREQ